MGCGCGKKKNGTMYFMGQTGTEAPDPTEWGPIVWKYLHCLAEKIGLTGSPVMDSDQALHMEILINTLHLIIPCPECQEHAKSYISAHPLPQLRSLQNESLRSTVRNWLFNFHNTVKTLKGQPITIETVEACREHYSSCFVPKCEYTHFIQNVAYAVRHNWVRIDNWKKWYSTSEKLRILIGNIIV